MNVGHIKSNVLTILLIVCPQTLKHKFSIMNAWECPKLNFPVKVDKNIRRVRLPVLQSTFLSNKKNGFDKERAPPNY